MRPGGPILAAMEAANPDVLVIGGGIVGCAVAREAAIRGWSVRLVEERDLAHATSSRSTKLLHGGLRYLERGDLRLVREALRERETTARLAPHLARPLGFVLPTRPGRWPGPAAARLGVALYDLLAGVSGLPRGRRVGAGEAASLLGADPRALWTGGVLFEDRQTDDARLTVTIARDAARRGAAVQTRCRVTSLLERSGRIAGAVVEDRETGVRAEVAARAVVNAAGPWADGVRSMAGEAVPAMRPSRGTHLVLPDLGLSRAVLFSGRQPRHRLFAIPWRGATLFGTTDVEAEATEVVEPGAAEIELLWGEAVRLFPAAGLTPERVLHAFAGLRPLVRGRGETLSLSREHRILVERGLVSVVGGKLTTWRTIAEDAVRTVARLLGRDASSHPASASQPLPGGEVSVRPDDPRLDVVPPETALRWTGRYGGEATRLADAVRADRGLREPLGTGGVPRLAEVEFAVLHEFARDLEDVLVRRLGLDHDPVAMAEAAGPAAARMRSLLGWSAERERDEIRGISRTLEAVRRRIRSALAGETNGLTIP